MSDWNQQIIEEFRANGGAVGGPFEGRPLLLLHHVGARTGAARVTPLMYQAVEGGYAIFASKAGADSNPDWYYNLMATPQTRVELGSEMVEVTAREIDGDDYDRIWSKQKADHPFFAEYEQKTARPMIPVIVLERR